MLLVFNSGDNPAIFQHAIDNLGGEVTLEMRSPKFDLVVSGKLPTDVCRFIASYMNLKDAVFTIRSGRNGAAPRKTGGVRGSAQGKPTTLDRIRASMAEGLERTAEQWVELFCKVMAKIELDPRISGNGTKIAMRTKIDRGEISKYTNGHWRPGSEKLKQMLKDLRIPEDDDTKALLDLVGPIDYQPRKPKPAAPTGPATPESGS